MANAPFAFAPRLFYDLSMKRPGKVVAVIAVVVLLGGVVASFPGLVRLYWRRASANPVRLGIERATELGCFHCHGPLGSRGIPDPAGEELEVPQWSGGMWMMYVQSEEEIREFILDGISRKRAASESAKKELEAARIKMPAFREYLRGNDLDNLVAAYIVLSGMVRPPESTPARRGYELSRQASCFSCHGPGGCGGLPNPGSFTGFIPGWYGKDFEDLVRSKEEFDAWVREGKIERLEKSWLARRFTGGQRVKMPAYKELSEEELNELWEYVRWLGKTRGGTSQEEGER